ncbi:hypothetical protein NEOLEDRAFT_1183000 [Neolentinus lepideus HHB14362 ss-1]|uniref:C2H2-type domain-containing protein n=1 Tax=Neolentinus lepideus HHB14362 ss-1 TaxID=1314782 RepID=A0A165NNR4_9AGAM|nr:hypothetical protein NEOLEDRAFT_1183000 [Neolentinus lepideus HHB14362 ss-1]
MTTAGNDNLFTCLSCSIAFTSAEEQRIHYRSDHHRYNMKRRVAGLPPVSAIIFNQKVVERKTETAVAASSKGSTCEVCKKTYTSENAYRSHLNSKKHKENELKAASTPKDVQEEEEEALEYTAEETSSKSEPELSVPSVTEDLDRHTVDESASDDAITQTIDAKIAAARSRLSPLHCLFCPTVSTSVSDNLTHMAVTHSFFIPDAEFLTDVEGLLTYLGEKVAVGNVCLYCNGKGREFRTLDAVRKHMVDKSHCKIAYEKEDDRLEVSDYYDFTSSYPDAKKKKQGDEEWEDVDGDEEDDLSADEVVDESEEESDLDELPNTQVTYGDSHLELVLPSGARIGHRSLKRYYAQSFHPRGGLRNEDPNSGAALVRRLLQEKNSALVPNKGGYGAYGQGYSVVKARNAGEAREAGRHVREFRDQKRREDFKTKVGFRQNNQKHFRDPLLQ